MSTGIDNAISKRSIPTFRSTPPPNTHTQRNDDLPRSFFPGFLASTDDDDDDDDDDDEQNLQFTYMKTNGSPSSSSSRSISPTYSPGLPYLVESPKSTSALSPSSSTSKLPSSQWPKFTSPTKSTCNTSNGTIPDRAKSTPLSIVTKSPGPKRRPNPLVLGKTRESPYENGTVGIERDTHVKEPLTASSVTSDGASSLSNDLQDLSLLRKTIRQNLMARPLDSPLHESDSDRGSSGIPTPNLDHIKQNSISGSEGELISIDDTLRLLHSSSQLLIIDTRPLGSFLHSHLPRSANISIPSLIFKRLRKSPAGPATSWESLGGFVSTQAGRDVWDTLETDRYMDVVIVGSTMTDELAKVLYDTLKRLVRDGNVKVLRGGWGSVLTSSRSQDMLVSGETSVRIGPTLSSSLPQPRSAPAFDISPVPPPMPPSSSPIGVNRQPDNNNARRNLPSLSITGGGANGPATSRRTPKLSLNLDRPLRSATFGSFNTEQSPPTPGAGNRSNLLSVDTGSHSTKSRSPRSPGLTMNIPKTPHLGSFQTLCHAQSKLPPSPSSFGGVNHRMKDGQDTHPQPASLVPGSAWGSNAKTNGSRTPGIYPTPDSRSSDGDEEVSTIKSDLNPFIVSTILPSFLYLGPEISSQQDVEYLKRIGVKRILNVALECNDDSDLQLKDNFRYHRIPMRDIVEESGVKEGMRESCGFLDDARLHSAPTYVHCKAGKSRSVTVVLAYLIHANAWTLKTSYAYVAERRKGISPNIGFVAELMQFEESELGLKQSGGVHGESSPSTNTNKSSNKRNEDELSDQRSRGVGTATTTTKPRERLRESLPPTWSSSLDTHSRPSKISHSPIGDISRQDDEKGQNHDSKERRQFGDEREVRKNGQWVHHRRAPVDRTTLQPGRRVSKAGLESLRPLNITSSTITTRASPIPSPHLGPGVDGKAGKHSVTPAGDGPLKWV
ncbi:uncharacterized protein IL334_004191 [Kwoniella shivajii]|uniref:protein-tyrosine-phosphatase n=1 Tax=Kwoniella shivajii TaxID=564305 RepID=A0ABZ1CZM5_9TREE|nr:hypothetical protein IL334_004191 [Kwoniella shivajii]